VLQRSVVGNPPKELPRALVEAPCTKALFGVLVEGLADRFEPVLCDVYARLFSQAVSHVLPELNAAALVARYERVRRPRAVLWKPHRVYVLSRVTLGADIAVTSVLLAAAKRRFPHAEITLAGPAKNRELFAADTHVHHTAVEYVRGSLRQRLAAWETLKTLLEDSDCLIIDPDSRLTQLGLLPVCAEERYHLFESRSFGAETDRTLPDLAAEWAGQTFGVCGMKPYIAVGRTPARGAYAAISLGVGENAAKRLPDPFEEELLKLLAAAGYPLCIDKGAGGEEAARVERAVQRAGVNAMFWEGSFAGFASIISGASLYVGYDSAGQHAAAACGVPLISVFAGFPVPRMFDRWRPSGPNCHVVRVDHPDPNAVLAQVEQALQIIRG
jgi:ADP-heptose:LPS heptosyltransferase